MAKPEWGLKRTCQSCGAHFYDLRRDPITCPKCDTEFDPEAVLKSKRTKTVVERPVPVEEPAVEEAVEGADDEVVEAEESEEEEVIEDTSELGEDDEDVADVIENVDEEDDR